MAPRRNPRRGTPEVVETTDSEIEVSDRTLSGLFPESSQKPPRWPVKPEELKDHVDYSLFEHYGWPPVKRQLPPRQKRWIHQGDTPITDAKEVPEGWNPNDLDIDEDDVEAQIARCMERIEDGIMPQIFQSKLKMYRQKKSAREAMIDYEKAGLSWEVVQRLQNLRIIEQHVSSQGDPDNQLPNIDALIAAYSFEGLEFKPGIVSYWSKGERIGPPSEFHENVHKEMLRTFDTTKSWWVEGLSGLGGFKMGQLMAYPPCNPQHSNEYMIDITANISVPHGAHFTLRACHDTGADIMGVPRHYIDMIQQAGVSLTTQGYCVVQIAGDIVCHKVYEFDVSLAGVGPAATSGLGPWMRVQVMELPDVPGPDFGRILSGPFLRFMCYTATCPDGQGNLYVTYNKTHLGYLPDLPPGFVPFGLPHLPTAPAPPGGGPPGSLTTSGAVASQTPAAPPQKRGKTPTRQAPRKKQRKAGI